jgi:hypothetical protein
VVVWEKGNGKRKCSAGSRTSVGGRKGGEKRGEGKNEKLIDRLGRDRTGRGRREKREKRKRIFFLCRRRSKQ